MASFISKFVPIETKIPFLKNYFQKTVKYFWDHMKNVQYITKKIKYTIPGRLRDRVAGAFVRYCNNMTPFPKMIASIRVGGATGLRRDLIMDKISRSLSGNLMKLKTLFLPPNWVTTGQVGFSDMGPALPLISHKTAKNGIPAVRTIVFDKIMWNFSEVFQNFIGSAVVFSSSS